MLEPDAWQEAQRKIYLIACRVVVYRRQVPEGTRLRELLEEMNSSLEDVIGTELKTATETELKWAR